jgi:Phosphatidylglycerol lysyltransferase, C-terminal
MDNTGPGLPGAPILRAPGMEESAMNEEETIQRIQSAKFSSSGVVYHFLQPGITRTELSDGSTVARFDDTLMGDPLTPDGGAGKFAESLSAELPGASVFHIEQKTATALCRQGYTICSMGTEPRVSLPFSTGGKDKSDLRRALNRSVKAGVVVRELDAREFASYEKEIATLNQRWLNNRRSFRREFRFLARPYVGRYQSGERRFVAFADGLAVGLAVYDPVYQDGLVVGYFEAIVRCFTTSLAGVRDHLTITAMRVFAEDSNPAQWVSLGLSPFAPVSTPENLANSSPVTRLVLSVFYRFGSRVFNCRGLAFHKDRYRGESAPVYFATRRPFPLTALYRACRLSYIDPLYFVIPGIQSLAGAVKLLLLAILSFFGFRTQADPDLAQSD